MIFAVPRQCAHGRRRNRATSVNDELLLGAALLIGWTIVWSSKRRTSAILTANKSTTTHQEKSPRHCGTNTQSERNRPRCPKGGEGAAFGHRLLRDCGPCQLGRRSARSSEQCPVASTPKHVPNASGPRGPCRQARRTELEVLPRSSHSSPISQAPCRRAGVRWERYLGYGMPVDLP